MRRVIPVFLLLMGCGTGGSGSGKKSGDSSGALPVNDTSTPAADAVVPDPDTGKICAPLEKFCHNQDLLLCQGDGINVTLIKTCPDDKLCSAIKADCVCKPSCAGKVCGGDGCGGTCGDCSWNETCQAGTCVDAPEPTDFEALEIFDDPSNSTLNPCDAGALATPGADIDAAELDTNGSIAQLKGCWGPSNVGACSNDMNNAATAEGAPDGDKESGFVSLNGGFIRCSWESGAAAKKGAGQVLTIYEIGGAGGGTLEQYGVRLCKGTSGNCVKESGHGSGILSLAVDSLF